MRKSAAALGLALFAYLLMFQNCGQGLKAASIPAESNSGIGTPDPVVPGPGPVLPGGSSFAKGDAFNYNSVSIKSQMLQSQIDSYGYAAYTGVKAIAVNAQGLGFIARKGAGLQSDANTTALEGCFALGGGSPCALLAAGNVFEVSSAALPVSYTFTMTAPATVSAAGLPFVMPNIRAGLIAQYTAAAAPKALAISVDGTFNWVAGDDATPATTLAEAKRVALERCEMNALVTPCTLFAENSTAVFNPASINRTPVINYARTQIAVNIPGMKDAHFTSLIQPYLNAVDGIATRGAIHLAGDGAGGIAYNPVAATAEANALNFCAMSVSTGFTCFRYAIDETIQNMAANLRAVTSAPVPHCKSVPRATCAAHRAMGCAPGMYYTMNGALPAAENCL